MRALLPFILAIALATASTPARADNASEPDARALFEQGVALASTQAWREAADRFRASLRLEVRASTLFNLAVTLYRLEEHAELLAVTTQYLGLNDPARSEADRAEMTKLQSQALERVARLRIAVSPSGAVVQLDGAVLEPSALASDVVLDPGAHTIAARADGYEAQEARVETRAGERASVHLSLTPAAVLPGASTAEPAAVRAAPTPFADYSDERRDRDDSSVWSSPWLWIGTGTVVAIGATVAVLLLAGDETTERPDYGRMTF